MPRDEAKAELAAIHRCDAHDLVSSTAELSERYLVARSTHWFVWLYYADSLSAMARYSEALAALRRGLRLCPPNRRHLVYYRFGHVHRRRGGFRLAERWYRRAAEASSADATYHIFLGALLAQAGRLDEAEAVHRRATRCRKGAIDEAFLNLGFVLRARRRYAKARKCFERALVLDPKYKEARKALSDVEHVLQITRNA
jgi:tetratricopeptide (TPR) repeat protein